MTDTTTDASTAIENEAAHRQINPEVLQNISVTLSIEVGRAMIKIRDLMRLTQGSVVELDRIAGEPLDLLVNNTVVAQGEIVLVSYLDLKKRAPHGTRLWQRRTLSDDRQFCLGAGFDGRTALGVAPTSISHEQPKFWPSLANH
jgi:flagellar motor switch protein FliN/FliY